MLDLIYRNLRNKSDKIAIVHGSKSLSYKELFFAAENLKKLLSNEINLLEIKVIPIIADRSIEFVVAALACWKLGVGYLPIAKNTPDDRIKFILKDSHSPLILVHSEISLNLKNVEILNWEINTLNVKISPLDKSFKNSLAYIIYTSGTTGVPKGCAIGFESLTPITKTYVDHFNIQESSRITVVANIAFDAIAMEIWPGLCSGSTLYIVNQKTVMLPQLLADFYKKNKITFSWLPTPIAEILMTEKEIELPKCLETIQTAGQRLTKRPPKHWQTKVENSYGPTEATVIATSSIVLPKELGQPSIGFPLKGVNCYVLDENSQQVKGTNEGELYISGVGVSRGYINHPNLNKIKFVKLKLHDSKSTLAYATGDICKYNPDGSLSYIGRTDNQLKLNGYRIEIGEIECQLANIHGVILTSVVCQKISEISCIVAYYTKIPNIEFEDGFLLSTLMKFLPEYMLPKYFVELDEFSFTSNGKINKSTLSLPASTLKKTKEIPLSFDEQSFLDLFNEYTVYSMSWGDDFFSVGGNSISAIRLSSEVYRKHSIVLPFETIYEYRTASAIWRELKNKSYTNRVIEPRSHHFKFNAPLSSSQSAVWYLANLNSQNKAYHAKAILTLFGEINVNAVKYSLQNIVDLHEIYRTTFVESNGICRQLIHSSFKVELVEINLKLLHLDKANAKLDMIIQETLNSSFKLDRLPLVRWALVQMPKNESVLVHIEHHLVHDGWSHNLFLKGFSDVYNGFCHDEVITSTYPIQYADFCIKQQEWLDSSEAQRQVEYWINQLKDTPEIINLPRDSHIDSDSQNGNTIRMKLPRETWEKIESLSASRGETSFSFIYTILNYVLCKFSGDKDICIGSAFANRNWVNSEQIIGMLINTVVLRTKLKDEMTFNELLTSSFQTVVNAQKHQELPFENVVSAINPNRKKGVNPLFQVFLGFHDSPMPEFSLHNVNKWKVKEAIDSKASKFDLSVVLIPRKHQEGEGDPVHILWEYKVSFFSKWFIEQLINSFVDCIDIFLENSNAKIFNLEHKTKPLIGKESPISSIPIIHRIIHKAKDVPSHLAINFRGEKLTYGELADKIHVKAAVLLEYGIKEENIIGICLDRNINMIIWMLAVQAVGATYIPLDPSYPDERLLYIVEHSKMSCIVSRTSNTFKCKQILSSALSNARYKFPNINLKSAMYVIYTSGSTGKPKGVAISHKAFINFIDSMAEKFPLTEDNTWLAVTSCSFDISTLELYLPLLQGATVYIASNKQAKDPNLLKELFAKQSITHFQATPTMWKSLIQHQWKPTSHLTGLCGGEELNSILALEILNCGVTLYNMYGPTETTVWSCSKRILKENYKDITLGHPINNTLIYILDEFAQPLPKGAIGELWIGGKSLARGYLNDKKLTQNSFFERNNQRIYKTGDFAAINEYDEVIFYGRLDRQIKLNGYRIELNEIEYILLQHVAVIDVIATTQVIGGSKLLVAFVISETDNANELKQLCKKNLPNYMVPNHICILKKFPLTPNGKIDKNNLPLAIINSISVFGSAKTNIEKDLVCLFKPFFGTNKLDINVTFFQLGGQSLMAMRLVSKIEQHFRISLSVADFMHLSTIKQIAAYIDSLNNETFKGEIIEELML